MSLSEREITNVLKHHDGGELEAIYGPSSIGDLKLWEVWVNKGSEYDVRFIGKDPQDETVYLDGFQELCHRVTKTTQAQLEKLQQRLQDRESQIELLKSGGRRKGLITGVAAVAFLACVGVLLDLLVRGTVDNRVMWLVGGVVASGAAMFFGRWIPMTTIKKAGPQ